MIWSKKGVEDEPRVEKEYVQTSLAHDIGALLLKILVIIICFVLIFTFLFGIFRNHDMSMKPAVKDGDLVIYYRLDKDYTATEVAAFKYKGKMTTGRVVAVAGDTVDITEDGLEVNGAAQQEIDISGKTNQLVEGARFPITLKQGEIFVLGDQREAAQDSRIFGAIKASDTKGKVIGIVRRRNI